jgi:hypothetical protein
MPIRTPSARAESASGIILRANDFSILSKVNGAYGSGFEAQEDIG